MNSRSKMPANLVDMNEAHRRLMTDRIDQMESRVLELEQSLLHHATRMYDVVTQKLDSFFSSESVVEMDSKPEVKGADKTAGPEGKLRPTSGLPQGVADTLELTRRQLEMLNQTIKKIQRSRPRSQP